MVKVTASAKMPQMKPAHHSFIQKHGEGQQLFYRLPKRASGVGKRYPAERQKNGQHVAADGNLRGV